MATAQLPGPITPLSETAKCSKHEDKPLVVYCKQCSKLICFQCWDTDHEDHPTTSALKQLQSLKNEVAKLMFSVSERTVDRKEALQTITDTITKEKGQYSAELLKRTQLQTDAVAQLNTQYQQLLSEAEGFYEKKKEALVELMTKCYQGETDVRIKTLEDASQEIDAECSQLEDLVSSFRTRLDTASGTPSPGSGKPTLEQLQTDCEALAMADVADLLPKLQDAVTPQVTSLPETKSPPAELIVPEYMKNYSVWLNTALHTLHEQAEKLLALTSDGFGAVVKTSFYEACADVVKNNAQITPKYKQAADPGKAYNVQNLKLKTVSEEAGKELARLCGGGDVLVREERHKIWVLRTTTGTVTHVMAYVYGIAWYWLPAGVSVVAAVRLAGISCSIVTDYHSKQDVSNTNTLSSFGSSSHCWLSIR